MTLALRGFIVGLFCASCAAYFYKPDFIVVLAAFVLGHWLGLAVAITVFLTWEHKHD